MQDTGVGMLPDRLPMINSLSGRILLIVVLVSSSGLWFWVVQRLLRDEPAVPSRPVPPVAWPTWVPCFAFPLGIVLVTLLQLLFERFFVDRPFGSVQVSCLSRFLVSLGLLALPWLAGPWRPGDFGLDSPGFPRGVLVEIGLGLAVALAAFPLVGFVHDWLRSEGWYTRPGGHPLLELLRSNASYEAQFWVLLGAVVLAPLFEELLYRVLLQGGWSAHAPAWIAITGTALMFSAAHFRPGQPDGIALFPFSLLLGWLYHRRRSYYGIFAAHSLYNFLNITLALGHLV
ncbi:MAG TPA: hypothetical protein DDY91_08740 [Planctomycetaceae bacterium]|nr:hypothetical protein [Planctomycetaceae bacterium]